MTLFWEKVRDDMNLEQIRREVENLVDDPSYDSETIDQYINQALEYVAANVLLPTLRRIGVVSTVVNQAYSDIRSIGSDSFSGILKRVIRSDGKFPQVYANLELFLDDYPTLDQEGDVEAVCLDGFTLWYQKIPAESSNLTVLCYINPSPLVDDKDTPPLDVPSHLHRKLFVNGASYMIYDQIEDGIDGEKINTTSNFFHSFEERSPDSGITKLREWLGKRRAHHISSVWRV